MECNCLRYKKKRNESWSVKSLEPVFINFSLILPSRTIHINKETEMKKHGLSRGEQKVITTLQGEKDGRYEWKDKREHKIVFFYNISNCNNILKSTQNECKNEL